MVRKEDFYAYLVASSTDYWYLNVFFNLFSLILIQIRAFPKVSYFESSLYCMKLTSLQFELVHVWNAFRDVILALQIFDSSCDKFDNGRDGQNQFDGLFWPIERTRPSYER